MSTKDTNSKKPTVPNKGPKDSLPSGQRRSK